MPDELNAVLASVGPRLRALRKRRGSTLKEVAVLAGISVSTLSRLESGRRRATLELLLPLARAYRLPLDELVGAPTTGDPRIHPRPIRRNGTIWVPLSRGADRLNAFKQIIPPRGAGSRPVEQQAHAGHEWLYVLSGELRLALGDREFGLGAGEAAEFDTRTPHAVVNAGDAPAELLIIFGPDGQRPHLRQ